MLHDVLGLYPSTFTFTKQYAKLGDAIVEAAATYVDEVRTRTWPDEAHSFR